MNAQRVVIEVDRIDAEAPGGPMLEAVGFIGPLGTRVVSACRARRYLPGEARDVIDALRADMPGLILRTVPAPRGVGAFERAMAGEG